jgi:hypothetical protein
MHSSSMLEQPAGARIEDASCALGLLGVLALPPIIQRADHVDALGLGQGVTEMKPAASSWTYRSFDDPPRASSAILPFGEPPKSRAKKEARKPSEEKDEPVESHYHR